VSEQPEKVAAENERLPPKLDLQGLLKQFRASRFGYGILTAWSGVAYP
jgi:hypothetical protein